MNFRPHLEAVPAPDSTDAESDWRKVVIAFQGDAVPRDSDEAKDPSLIEARLERAKAEDRRAKIETRLRKGSKEAGQKPIPGINKRVKEAMGLTAAKVVELPRDN